MNRTMKGAAKGIVLCITLQCAGCAGDTHQQSFSKAFAVQGRATVHIRAADASLRVVSSDAPEVDFNVTYEEPVGSDTTLPISARQTGNVLELTANEDPTALFSWNRFTSHRVSIAVRMPKNADLQVSTSNGSIEASAIDGVISLHTSNGPVRAEQLSGTIDISSSNGPITASAVLGNVKAHTSNGKIMADGRFQALELSSSNGTVAVRAAAGSELPSGWIIRTNNAGVDLSVPTELKANLDLRTTNGGIGIDLPVTAAGEQSATRFGAALNGGGPEVSIHTSNGHIHVGKM